MERLRGKIGDLLQFCSLHFTNGALNYGENDRVLAWMPVDYVTKQVRDRYDEATEVPGEYYHLFLRK